MKNKELFDKASNNNDSILKGKLRDNFADWCKKNGRTLYNPIALNDWFNEEVNWNN